MAFPKGNDGGGIILKKLSVFNIGRGIIPPQSALQTAPPLRGLFLTKGGRINAI